MMGEDLIPPGWNFGALGGIWRWCNMKWTRKLMEWVDTY